MGHGYPNNEGIFWMDIDSYKKNFETTSINQDTSNWHLGYFTMLDDEEENTINDSYCNGCTKHILKVTNTGARQTVHIGAHIW